MSKRDDLDTILEIAEPHHQRQEKAEGKQFTKKTEILRGMTITVCLHVLQIFLYAGLAIFGEQGGLLPDTFIVIIGFGIIQAVYVIPAMIIMAVKRRPFAVVGIVVAAGITLLLQAAIWGIFFSGAGSFSP